MRKTVLSLSVVSSFFLVSGGLVAQTLSGFSTVEQAYTCKIIPPVSGCPKNQIEPEIFAYTETSEDYTASLYYNVSSNSSLFSSGNPNATATSGMVTSNPNVVLVFNQKKFGGSNVLNGLWTAATNHYVDFFYVTAVGEYFDPYGFSQYVQSTGEGDYNSGYWFSVYADIYVAEASVLLGESYDSANSQPNQYQGQQVESVLYQSFIAPDWIYGPPAASCLLDIYAGDDRGNDPALASYRTMQGISVGVGGLTSINPGNAPPAEATGWTYQFSSSVLQNNVIPDTAYNLDYLQQCSAKGINGYGHASTSTFNAPTVDYVNANDTQVSLGGISSNPVPLLAFPIYWASNVELTEPNSATLYVGGYLRGTCYPHHELSVGLTDVASWQPTYENNIAYITFCLGGGADFQLNLQTNIPLVPVPIIFP